MTDEAAHVGEYTEWRVTADPDYDFTWSLLRNPHLGDPEASASNFVEKIASTGHLTNIKLLRRVVTIAPWEEWRP